jgi:serine/threonine protein kinase
MEFSVEGLCNQMARSRLLDPTTVRSLRQRWRREAGPAADDADKFASWLIANRQLTDFQLGLLTRGFGDMVFFGDYKLVDRIGQGRMAGIYKAVHPTGQVVALKVLPPSKANHPQLLGRFQREARLALRLNHDNVVRAFECGQTKAGMHYIVLEYLEGETLEEVLKRRQRLSVPEAAHVLVQAFQGLQYLHEEALVHRDLKPANLMLVGGQADGLGGTTVKILDMGLGRALFDLEESPPGLAENAELTAEGSLLGTPNYMAPEQARNARLADIRSDIYSLGCVLYAALTGQPPFPDTSFLRQMVRHATERPRPLKELVPEAPEELQAVMDRLLAKDPAQRYSTPAQAARALQGFVAPDRPVATPAEAVRALALPPLESSLPVRVDGQPATAALAGPLAALPLAPLPLADAAPALTVATAVPVSPASAPRMAVPIAEPIITPRGSRHGPAPDPLWRRALHALERRGITRRDLLMAGAGAGLVLLVEAFIWLVLRLFR